MPHGASRGSRFALKVCTGMLQGHETMLSLDGVEANGHLACKRMNALELSLSLWFLVRIAPTKASKCEH